MVSNNKISSKLSTIEQILLIVLASHYIWSKMSNYCAQL